MRINHDNKSVDMEQRDINYILPAYVRSYLFYTKNEMPEKIIFPMFPSIVVGGNEITIEYILPTDPIAVEIAQDGADIHEVTPEEEVALDEKDDRVKEMKEEVASLTPAPEDVIRQQEEDIQQLEDDTADKQLEVDTTPDAPKEVSPARAAFAEPQEEGNVTAFTDPDALEGFVDEQLEVAQSEATEEPKAEPKDTADSVPPTTPPPAPSIVREPKQPPRGDIGPGLSPSDMQPRDRRDQIRTAKDLREEPDINEAEEKEYEKPISRDEQGRPVVDETGED